MYECVYRMKTQFHIVIKFLQSAARTAAENYDQIKEIWKNALYSLFSSFLSCFFFLFYFGSSMRKIVLFCGNLPEDLAVPCRMYGTNTIHKIQWHGITVCFISEFQLTSRRTLTQHRHTHTQNERGANDEENTHCIAILWCCWSFSAVVVTVCSG